MCLENKGNALYGNDQGNQIKFGFHEFMCLKLAFVNLRNKPLSIRVPTKEQCCFFFLVSSSGKLEDDSFHFNADINFRISVQTRK